MSHRRTGRAGLLAVALSSLLWLGQASAQPRPTSVPTAGVTPATEEQRAERARRLYEKGLTHYNLAEYDQAIAAFKESYRLVRAPELLYDVAQEYRLKGDCAEALRFYRTYLREDPRSPKRARVEERIAEMEACEKRAPTTPLPPPASAPTPSGSLASPVGAPTPAAPLASPTGATPAAAPAAPRWLPADAEPASGRGHDRPRARRIAGIVLAAAGAALVGTAVYLSVRAGSAADEVTALYDRGGAWDDRLAAVERDGSRSSAAAIALYSVGGAALAGGGLLYLLGGRESRAHLGAAPTRGGVAMEFAWPF